MTDPPAQYVGRGGLKLLHALREFAVDPAGAVCADFGCNVGGFTDCLLQHGAARIYAVDTGYGALAWKLRQDPRVVVMERTNALHAQPPRDASGAPIPIDIIAIDMGWTPQRHAIPAALKWLGPAGIILSLIKPHYELLPEERGLLVAGVLPENDAERIARRAADALAGLGITVRGLTRSPIAGGHSKGNRRGNTEWLAHLRRA